MTDKSLGRLQRVDLRQVFTSESNDFTPWLAQEENLKLLGKITPRSLSFLAILGKRRMRSSNEVRNITTQKIRPAISVRVDFITHQGKTVSRIFVPRGEQPLYFVDHEIYVREQTSNMKATPEQVEGILSKFYQ